MKGGGNGKSRYERELIRKTYQDHSDSGSTKGGVGTGDDPCQSLNATTSLHNLQPAIAKHSVGDILKVLKNAAGTVVAVGNHGQCGTIIGGFVTPLKRCMEAGHDFKATISKIAPNSCEVVIRLYRP